LLDAFDVAGTGAIRETVQGVEDSFVGSEIRDW
jgi:hypothetical protein